MRKKTVVLLLVFMLMAMLITACGTNADNGTSEENKQKNAEDKMLNEVLKDTEGETESKAESKTDVSNNTETADMSFDETTVKSVVIADGNTGDRVELEETAILEILRKLNEMEFVSIESEAYTGWTYSMEITYADGSTSDITVTSNEKIQCARGDDVKYYKTEADIIQLIDSYYNKNE